MYIMNQAERNAPEWKWPLINHLQVGVITVTSHFKMGEILRLF